MKIGQKIEFFRDILGNNDHVLPRTGSKPLLLRELCPKYSFKVFLVTKLAYANIYEPQNFCVDLFFDAEQVCKKKLQINHLRTVLSY